MNTDEHQIEMVPTDPGIFWMLAIYSPKRRSIFKPSYLRDYLEFPDQIWNLTSSNYSSTIPKFWEPCCYNKIIKSWPDRSSVLLFWTFCVEQVSSILVPLCVGKQCGNGVYTSQLMSYSWPSSFSGVSPPEPPPEASLCPSKASALIALHDLETVLERKMFMIKHNHKLQKTLKRNSAKSYGNPETLSSTVLE